MEGLLNQLQFTQKTINEHLYVHSKDNLLTREDMDQKLISVGCAHHLPTNIGNWIHLTLIEEELMYKPHKLHLKEKYTVFKEHSLYIYNPSLVEVKNLKQISLKQLISDKKLPLFRIHSSCRFGDSFGSQCCDCGPQLTAAKFAIIQNGGGFIIYLDQQGRNLGLSVKSAGYSLKDRYSIKTNQSCHILGLPEELRKYDVVVDIFSLFEIKKASMLTNNPKKIEVLRNKGIQIEQKSHNLPPSTHNIRYLRTKRDEMGHTLLDPEKPAQSYDEVYIKMSNVLNKIIKTIKPQNLHLFTHFLDNIEGVVHFCAFFDHVRHPEFHFLSNFYDEIGVVSQLGNFRCSEGLYQFQKFAYLNDDFLKTAFQQADGKTAYALSRKLERKIIKNWDKITAMKKTLEAKFSNEILKKKLLATKSAFLVENGDAGHDAFWSDFGDGSGQNMMGKLLMELRQKLGGCGIVEVPEILKSYYTKKCIICSDNAYFTNTCKIDDFCHLHKGFYAMV